MKIGNPTLTLALLATVPFASADELRLKDGSVIKGKIVSLESGAFTIESPSIPSKDKDTPNVPGTLTVKQSEVVTFSTDEAMFIATAGRTEANGPVNSTSEGVSVKTPDGVVASKVDNLRDAWRPGAKSPAEKAADKLKRRWEYTMDVSVIGKTGNGESIGAAGGIAAVNKGPDDELKFYAKANYAKAKADTGWNKTADDLHAGVDYVSYFHRPFFWYVRSDNGYDKVRQIQFFSTDAAGLGSMLIDNDQQHLSVRGGLSYRFESYRGGIRGNLSSPGLDFGLHHDCEFKYFVMVNDLSVTPTFDDFSDFIALHDSYIEMPLANTESWKLRMGVSNQYRSKVLPNVDRLDTTYYLKFVLNWK